MFSKNHNVSQRDLKSQIDEICRQKQKIAIDSQHFEKIKSLTKNADELQNLEKKVMKSRQSFLNYGINNF
ncbi:hypothetical protein [Thysanoplusia orichalcea nucleopolyhedrovirus]|uniref:Uncharacterized protein n=1 Tax=Thysanoplusia orichalcea nucleopolyhedrovirus TaxID=101850 RepID=L0CLF6_9ABAC|nr:hypothetical protein [Thysanoplusia orichalcea nucleopolyhedrovirus]AGA16183.1 hypothetical protein [Thysanoplusia orichalcea nucleopolyhedrovirus]